MSSANGTSSTSAFSPVREAATPSRRRDRSGAVAAALACMTVLWPAALGAATLARANGRAPVWSGVTYFAASRLCHQRPDRTFHAGGAPWPVCGRCSGLYLAAPVGAAAALVRRRRRRSDLTDQPSLRWAFWLAAAALPTGITLFLEWSGVMSITSVARAVAATPLGLAVAWALIDVLPRVNRVH
jgi:uncharacterized membrane protein